MMHGHTNIKSMLLLYNIPVIAVCATDQEFCAFSYSFNVKYLLFPEHNQNVNIIDGIKYAKIDSV